MAEYPSCQQCGAPMNHSPSRGGWYCPECRMAELEKEISQLCHDLLNEQAASRMAHEVVARNRALEAENAQLRHALANAQVAAGFAKEMSGKVRFAQERADRLRGWLEDIAQHTSCDDCYAERKCQQAITEDAGLTQP